MLIQAGTDELLHPQALALHDALVAAPRRAIAEREPAAVRDEDARDNYRVWLRFRDRLAAAPSLQSAYLRLFQGDGVDVPPTFVHELTQVLLRHILGERADPFEARAAEMLFRHVAVTFDRTVHGPVLVGAGRYLGVGLLAPVRVNRDA